MNHINHLSASLGRHYLLATDGGCKPNPGTGGWGCVKQLRFGTEVVQDVTLSGGYLSTSNNRMELTAAREGLCSLMEPELPVLVVTDSKYLRDGVTLWLPQWKRKGWRKGNGQPVLNRDLWEALDNRVADLNLTWFWLPAHAGHDLNERADAAATAARDSRGPKPSDCHPLNGHGFRAEPGF